MTCYLVLGAPRSGTSLAAGIIHHLGIPMGQRILDPVDPRWDFAGADDWNAKGHFEDGAFVNWCLANVGWPVQNRDIAQADLTALSALINNRCAANVDWGVKSAGLAYVASDFISLCPCPVRLVVCRRDLALSMASWRARTGGQDVSFVTATAQRLEQLPSAPTLELTFTEEQITNWPQALADYCGVSVTAAALEMPDPSLLRF